MNKEIASTNIVPKVILAEGVFKIVTIFQNLFGTTIYLFLSIHQHC